MDHDETPTPKLSTGTWEVFETGARELAEKLRAREFELGRVGSSLDIRKATRARQMRMLCESYAETFRKWNREVVPAAEKYQERDEFIRLSGLVMFVLGEVH